MNKKWWMESGRGRLFPFLILWQSTWHDVLNALSQCLFTDQRPILEIGPILLFRKSSILTSYPTYSHVGYFIFKLEHILSLSNPLFLTHEKKINWSMENAELRHDCPFVLAWWGRRLKIAIIANSFNCYYVLIHTHVEFQFNRPFDKRTLDYLQTVLFSTYARQ